VTSIRYESAPMDVSSTVNVLKNHQVGYVTIGSVTGI
jgi:hypothetical protein